MADTSSTHHNGNWSESKSFDANASLEAGRNAAKKAAELAWSQLDTTMKNSAQHIEAISGASAELTHGLQEISREWMAYAKQGTEKLHAGFGALAQCRSPQEFFEVQSRLTKENLEAVFAGARRISEVSTAVATKATQKIAAAQQTSA